MESRYYDAAVRACSTLLAERGVNLHLNLIGMLVADTLSASKRESDSRTHAPDKTVLVLWCQRPAVGRRYVQCRQ